MEYSGKSVSNVFLFLISMVMEDISDENINSSDLKDSKLYKSYLDVLNIGNDNEDFRTLSFLDFIVKHKVY
ncbi:MULTISPECIES: hypothetical protein [Clostridium]|uniref:Uncharacterized protein n=2 Tax=Clostridium novyi TaxID=1542 RepID=A0Q1X9_CLONN|nr:MULTISPECIES: hypothetical protein [Clostridium]ABK62291.1 hypothetical protein NT01CX_0122 [Clostridium novyi NT]